MRSESADSVLNLPLPLEEYNQIAANNQIALKPYLDQCRSLVDASVCRLNFSAIGTQNQIELFVVINGNEISIVPSTGASRGIASDSLPEPVRPLERDRTLEELRRELGTR